MRLRRVPRIDAISAILKLIQSCEGNSDTRYQYEKALLTIHSEIERVLELKAKRTDESIDSQAQRKANIHRAIEEKRFRLRQ